ncbi:MAG: S-layer homology domain-containing protein, partial [Firmicutes bacterium]|nr:S-layer homology domain-containing protein [Bacillota bacterium]
PAPSEPDPEEPAPAGFVDVPEGAYYEKAVDWAVENGVTAGTDETHFSPDTVCTRAQVITMLWAAAGAPSAELPGRFEDVAESDYYAKAVAWAVENGVTAGTDGTHFSPDAPCTRAQVITMLWAAAGVPSAEPSSRFEDVAEDAYYARAVAWALEKDVTAGTDETHFSPDAVCTRAQAVTFLYMAMGGE